MLRITRLDLNVHVEDHSGVLDLNLHVEDRKVLLGLDLHVENHILLHHLKSVAHRHHSEGL